MLNKRRPKIEPCGTSKSISCHKPYESFTRTRCFLFEMPFFNCYFAVTRPTLGHSQGFSLTNPMLITAFVQVRPEGHREPRSEVGSLSPAELLAGFEPGTFQIWLQRINLLGHSPHKKERTVERTVSRSSNILPLSTTFFHFSKNVKRHCCVLKLFLKPHWCLENIS